MVRLETSAHDVVAELQRRLGSDLAKMKLQKLLYYCQGWSLAWQGVPMFHEPIEAWTDGPVVPDVWRSQKPDAPPVPPTRPVRSADLATIDYVIERYGHLSGSALSAMTHAESPWRDAMARPTLGIELDGGSPVIGRESLREWFLADRALNARNDQVAALRARRNLLDGPAKTAELRTAIDKACQDAAAAC